MDYWIGDDNTSGESYYSFNEDHYQQNTINDDFPPEYVLHLTALEKIHHHLSSDGCLPKLD